MALPFDHRFTWDTGFSGAKHSPTAKDRALFAEWTAIPATAEAAQKVPLLPHNDLSDALAAYRHYLYGEGKDRTFSYERYVINDLSGKATLENALDDIEEGAQQPNGELEAAGLAHGYMNYSTLQRTVRWTATGAPVLMPTGGGRVRQPEDNRRLRNRL